MKNFNQLQKPWSPESKLHSLDSASQFLKSINILRCAVRASVVKLGTVVTCMWDLSQNIDPDANADGKAYTHLDFFWRDRKLIILYILKIFNLKSKLSIFFQDVNCTFKTVIFIYSSLLTQPMSFLRKLQKFAMSSASFQWLLCIFISLNEAFFQ